MPTKQEPLQANFSVLAMSIASSAAMALGLVPDPQSGKHQKDTALARFNVDLLLMLQEKTKGKNRVFVISLWHDFSIHSIKQNRHV